MRYDLKEKDAIERLNTLKKDGGVSLKPKYTSHFFRKRKKRNKLDLTSFNEVISVDPERNIAEVEGLTTFYDITKETLRYKRMPQVIPELRNITIGGAISGLGIESSSFRYGMVHDTLKECYVLTGTGKVVTCSPSQNKDLFNALPNSLGTLGYTLKCKIGLFPVKDYVKLSIKRYDSLEEYFKQIENICKESKYDFVDGVIFSKEHSVLVVGEMTDQLPEGSSLNNFQKDIYWKFLRDRSNETAYLKIFDYVWRWDVDTFWGTHRGDSLLTKLFENKLLRITIGRYFLRSDRLFKVRHALLNHESNWIVQKLIPTEQNLYENLTQDVGVEIGKAKQLMDWYFEHIDITPIWVCPSIHMREEKMPLFPSLGDLIIDLGFYSSKKRDPGTMPNHYNRLIEEKLLQLNGMKGLYSTSFYSTDEFWSIYDKDGYDKVKNMYDPEGVFPQLYEKAVGYETL